MIKRSAIWWAAALASSGAHLGACASEEAPPANLGEATEATVAGSFRTRDGAPLEDSRVTIGAEDLRPDPAGLFRFPEQLPGRLIVRTDLEGWTIAGNAVPMLIGATSSTRLVAAPRVADARDLGAEVTLGGDDLTISFAAGSLERDGAAAVGTADFSYYRVVGPDEATPAHRTWLRADQYEEPFEAFAIVEIPPPVQEGETLDVVANAVSLTFEVGADWPHADREELGLYVLTIDDGWWKKSRSVEVVDGVITTALGSLGWIAIGAQGADVGCVTGRVLLEGAGVYGAEITAGEPTRVGVDRVYTDEQGVFCANATAGVETSLTLLAWGALGDVVGTHSLTASAAGTSCREPASCADVGALDVTWFSDGDGDSYWPGQGDCDDSNVSVNPIASGDLCIGD